MKKCVITTASNMSDDTYLLLCSKVKNKFGNDIVPERVTDDSIIGGFIINLDGEVFDLSINSQLGEMKKHLSE